MGKEQSSTPPDERKPRPFIFADSTGAKLKVIHKVKSKISVMKTYTHYLYDLAENGKAFGCWYTCDEVATMLANGKALYYDSALTLKATEA